MYYQGQGVSQNYAKGREWLLKAAEGGSAKAQMALSHMYYFGKFGAPKDNAKAVYWCRKAAAQLFDEKQCALSSLSASFINARINDNLAMAKADIQAITSALNLYKLDNYTYPTTQQGLQALVSKPVTSPIPPYWNQYLSKVPKDPWGHPYHYVYPGTHGEPFDLWVNGSPDQNGMQSRVIGNWNISDSRSDSNGNSGLNY